MTDYWGMLKSLALAPANAMMAQPPKANLGGGLMEKLHNAIDPVQAFGGYGNMMAMALPMGRIQSARHPGLNILRNPKRPQIENLLKKSDFKSVRAMWDDDGNMYVWDANKALHPGIANDATTGIKGAKWTPERDVYGGAPSEVDRLFATNAWRSAK